MSEGSPEIASIGASLEDHITDQHANNDTLPLLQEKPLTDMSVSAKPHIPSVSASAVLGESASMPKDSQKCQGHDFEQSARLDSSGLDCLLDSFATMPIS